MSALIRVLLSKKALQINPGEKAEVALTVQNFSEIVDRYKISVDGVEPGWVVVSRDELSLFPKDQDQVKITFSPPAGMKAKAGHYDVQVQVVSQENPTERTIAPIDLAITAHPNFEVALQPQKQRGGIDATYTVRLRNLGNADLTVSLEAEDAENGCTYTLTPARISLPAGGEANAALKLISKGKPGKEEKTYRFTITAGAKEVPALVKKAMGEWTQLPAKKSKLPLIGAAVVAALVLVIVAYAATQLLGKAKTLPVLPSPTVVPTVVATLPATTSAPAVNVAATQTVVAQSALNRAATATAVAKATALANANAATKATATAVAKITATAAAQSMATAAAKATAQSDVDNDGLTYAQEMAKHTDPNNADTDGDGLKDGVDPEPLVPQDKTPPAVKVSVSPSQPSRNDKITFTATATDNKGVDKIALFVNAAQVKTCLASPCVYVGGPYPEQNRITYSATAWDKAGNQATSGEKKVVLASVVLYDFLANANHARWRSGAGTLPFNGSSSDTRGFVKLLSNSPLETNNKATRALETHPQWVNSGYIQGQYDMSDYIVKKDDYFYAWVGLLKGATSGNVHFQVYIMPAGSAFKLLADVGDTYDGKLKEIKVPLSAWRGKRITAFYLRVNAGASSTQDWALWTSAVIYRGAPPTLFLIPLKPITLYPINPATATPSPSP